MDYGEYLQALRAHGGIAEVCEYGVVSEGGRDYPLLKLTVPGERLLVITAGFHGEEPAGPLTLAKHLPEIAAFARSKGVGLSIYPCVNPSGFEAGTRYNASGERPNNDFLRYETTPGVWKGELRLGEPFLRYRLFDEGPKETRALRPALEALPAPAAALDIHQDNWMVGAHTYAYVFGPHREYLPLMRAASEHAKVAASCAVHEDVWADPHGLVHYCDGSITDYFMRRGVRFTAALETTTVTSLEACHRVNLVWIRGFVELASRP
ncbi:MAG: M14 family metallopeptidase [Myxococcaceae bacterium]